MSYAGGSATIHGILYQILGSIHWACELMLDAHLDEGVVRDAQLIVEPAGGGDLVVETAERRIVEQWKSRRTGRSWTIRSILRDVLPDLYAATDSNSFNRPVVYRFRAEGTVADWRNASVFFQRLQAFDAASFSVEALDDTTATPFLSGTDGTMSEQGFFLWIADQVGAAIKRRGTSVPRQDLHRRLCHLLANFEIPPSQSATDLVLMIDDSLRPWVDYTEGVSAKRHELCGRLLKIAANGPATVYPQDLLQSVGLDTIPLTEWARIRSNLNQHTDETARSLLHYNRDLDVRSRASWPSGSNVLVLAGNSGFGKSWQLASLVSNCANADQAVVLIRSRGDAELDLEAATRTVWHEGAERESPPAPLSRLSERIRKCNPKLDSPWLIVLIDDVRCPRDAQRLIELPWDNWRVRLAFTVPEDVGARLIQRKPPGVDVRNVGFFTHRQLREYLRRRGRDWTGIPSDIREHLQRPLLAGLYCDLHANPSWRPENEYDVFAEVWQLLRSHPLQSEHPDDQAALRELAGDLLEPGSEYPWPLKRCREVGLDSEAITRLERIGWLSRENGRVAIWHNRLLHWAVAETLADRLRFGGSKAADEVCRVLCEVVGQQPQSPDRFLGYVFMDLLWLVSAPDHPARASSDQILMAAEAAIESPHYPRNTYERLLPTLGGRIIETIIRRLRKAPRFCSDLLPHLATSALVRIGSPAAERAAVLLLDEESDIARDVGVRVLTKCPTAAALDRLWAEYERLGKTTSESDDERRDRRDAESRCARAIRVCGPLDPTWLLQTVQRQGQHPRAASVLAEILATLESDGAEQIWEETREILARGLHEECGPLSRCLQRFRDASFVELLESGVDSEDFQHVDAGFRALCVVAPDRALDAIPRLPVDRLGWWSGSFETLWCTSPSQLRRRLRQVMERGPQDAAYASQAYLHCSHRLDVELLGTLFNALDGLLVLDKSGEPSGGGALLALLRLLRRVATADLLKAFRALRDGPLEAKLAAQACRWLADTESRYQLHLREVPKVLLRIGGAGLTRFVNAQLQHPDQQIKFRGIGQAIIRPDKETRRLLIAIVKGIELKESARPRASSLQREAVEALAAVGEDAAVVAGIVSHGADVRLVRFLREGQQPISDADLAPAFDALESDDPLTRERAFFAIGISGRRDLIPLVKDQLASLPSDGNGRQAALWALHGLRADDDESVECFARHLEQPEYRFVALCSLLQTGRADARQRLVAGLDRLEPDLPGSPDSEILCALAAYPDSREAVLARAGNLSESMTSFRAQFRDLRLIELLGDVRDPAVTDRLLQEAEPFESNFNVTGRRRAVIRALAKHDPEAAYEAAVSALTQGRHDCHLFPGVLTEIDTDRAVPFLCSHLPGEDSPAVRRAICVALRHANRQELVELLVMALLQQTADERSTAAEIIQWMGPEFLTNELAQRALTERIDWTRGHFMQAARWHEAERHAGNLLRELATGSGVDSWCIVETLFDAVPPECLGCEAGLLWIGPYYDGFPPALREHVDKRYEDHLKQPETG